ncbi:MAG: TlpA disulfide reductase family protein [bacterium]
MKRYITFYIIFVSILLIFYGCKTKDGKQELTIQNEYEVPKTVEESKMPSFTLTSMDGTTINSDEFKGKVLLIDFWATWCPPCREAIPHLIELKKEFKDTDFDIIGISLDDPKKIDKVKDFISQVDINYTICMSSESVESAFGGITAIPTIFLFNKHGNFVKKWVGFEKKVADEISVEVKKQLQSGS